MNEEEVRERCKQIIKDNNEIIKEARKNRDINSMQLTASLDNDSIAIETVLNLLEKKDKEIQFQKEINKTEQNRHKQTEKSLKGQLQKKDKIIDLMAYDIATNDSDLCQYIDETIRCKKYAGENKLTCDECIKQYFERKLENGN